MLILKYDWKNFSSLFLYLFIYLSQLIPQSCLDNCNCILKVSQNRSKLCCMNNPFLIFKSSPLIIFYRKKNRTTIFLQNWQDNKILKYARVIIFWLKLIFKNGKNISFKITHSIFQCYISIAVKLVSLIVGRWVI